MTTTGVPLADARDMFAVHTMFRREFGLTPDLVRGVTVGDQQRVTVVADHIDLLNSVLHMHHSGEDKHVWPRLRQRGSAEITSIVGLMEEQHAAIHKGYLQVNEALASWRGSGSAEARDTLADAVDRLCPLLDEHLALEEQRVVPLIEKYVTAAEYALLGQEGGADTPPDMLPTIFGMMMYEGEPETMDMVAAQLPAEIQLVIKDVAARAYAEYAEELYGTATPPRVTA